MAVKELKINGESKKSDRKPRKRRKIKTFDIVAIAILILIGLIVLFSKIPSNVSTDVK